MALAGGGEQLLLDCRSGWLAVERDFSAPLTRQEQLTFGTRGKAAAACRPSTNFSAFYGLRVTA